MGNLTFIFSETASIRKSTKEVENPFLGRGGVPLTSIMHVPTGYSGHDVIRIGEQGKPLAVTHIIEGDNIQAQLDAIRQQYKDAVVVQTDVIPESYEKILDGKIRTSKTTKSALTEAGKRCFWHGGIYVWYKGPFELRDYHVLEDGQRNSEEAAKNQNLAEYNKDVI